MTHEFLSDDWFEAVQGLLEQGPPALPEALADVVVNVTVDDVGVEATYRGCWFEPGHSPDATARLHTTRELAYEVMVKKNMALGMRALATGKARLAGERAKLMRLRATRPSPDQEVFEQRVRDMTTL
ncbi:MAG TPA: hypothetical protein VGA36_08075 [Nitriliruptorales bacterium]|jgi:hypothetical protein